MLTSLLLLGPLQAALPTTSGLGQHTLDRLKLQDLDVVPMRTLYRLKVVPPRKLFEMESNFLREFCEAVLSHDAQSAIEVVIRDRLLNWAHPTITHSDRAIHAQVLADFIWQSRYADYADYWVNTYPS